MSQAAIATRHANPSSPPLSRLVSGGAITTSDTNLCAERAGSALGVVSVRSGAGLGAGGGRVQRLAWVHSRSRSSGQVLTIRSAGMSFAAARAQP